MEFDANTATLLAGAAGLIGSIIGGAAGYMGSKSAAQDSIRAQRAFFQEQIQRDDQRRLQQVKACARTIYADLFNAIQEFIRINKDESLPYAGRGVQLLSYDPNYTEKINALSEHLEWSDIQFLYVIYGYISKYNNYASADSITRNGYDDSKLISKTAGTLIFGAFFEGICSQTNTRSIEHDKLIEEIGIQSNKELFKKLQRLL